MCITNLKKTNRKIFYKVAISHKGAYFSPFAGTLIDTEKVNEYSNKRHFALHTGWTLANNDNARLLSGFPNKEEAQNGLDFIIIIIKTFHYVILKCRALDVLYDGRWAGYKATGTTKYEVIKEC